MASAALASRVNGSRLAFSTRRNVAQARPVRMNAVVTIKTPTGESPVTIDADTFILDAAEEAGMDLPYSCRAGACSSCAAKFISGEGGMSACIDLGEQSFLGDEQIEAGYFLSCVAYIKQDCTIETHMEEKLY